MFLITVLLPLLFSCEKQTPEFNLSGQWGLRQTELFENDQLNGAIDYEEISTYYHFDNCHNQSCRLIITTDGEEEAYDYVYNPSTLELTVGANNTYKIEILNETDLVFTKNYSPYRSRYSFQKVE